MKWQLLLAAVLGLLAISRGNMDDCDCVCECPDPPTPPCTDEPTTTDCPTGPPGDICDNFVNVDSSFMVDCAPCMDQIMIDIMFEDCIAFQAMGPAALEAFLENIAAICLDQNDVPVEFPPPPTGITCTPTPTPPPIVCTTEATCDAFMAPYDLETCDGMATITGFAATCQENFNEPSYAYTAIENICATLGIIADILEGILGLLTNVLAQLQTTTDCLDESECITIQTLVDDIQTYIDSVSGWLDSLAAIVDKLRHLCDLLRELLDRWEELDECVITTTTSAPMTLDCTCVCTCPYEYNCNTTTVIDTTTTTCIPVTECDSFTDDSSDFSQLCAPCMDDIIIKAMIEDCAAFLAAGDIDDFIANIKALCDDQTGDMPDFPTVAC